MVKSVITFITFTGDCSDALSFYADVFGAEISEKTTYGEAEMSEKEEHCTLIMNSTFLLGGHTFSCYDSLTQATHVQSNISSWLEIENEGDLLKMYSSIVENGGKIVSPLEDTFWNSKYVKLQDKYGVIWELNAQN